MAEHGMDGGLPTQYTDVCHTTQLTGPKVARSLSGIGMMDLIDCPVSGTPCVPVAMNVKEICDLRAKVSELEAALKVARDAAKKAIEMIETNAYERRHVRWELIDAITKINEVLKP